jgi:hypothetical protein
MKFLAQYDKDPMIEKVFRLLMILEDYDNKIKFSFAYDFKEGLEKFSKERLNKKKVKQMTDMIRQEKYLNFDHLININPSVANLFLLVSLFIRLYEIEEKIESLKIQSPDDKKNDKNYPSLMNSTDGTGANVLRPVSQENNKTHHTSHSTKFKGVEGLPRLHNNKRFISSDGIIRNQILLDVNKDTNKQAGTTNHINENRHDMFDLKLKNLV